MTIQQFNILSIQQIKEEFLKCCGCTNLGEQLSIQIPFASIEELKSKSDKIWFSLNESDWKEAFSHHPKIGDIKSLENKFASAKQWASGEQSGVDTATSTVLQELKDGNEAYENKFGFIFIVCATGKSAKEMLQMLKSRIKNNPAEEIKIAAEEQNKITHIRIDKLFS